jgi:hypothetical protein
MSDVDDLFGSEDGARPNRALVFTLLCAGLLLSLVGLFCTVLPGGVLTLLGFHYADRDVDRVDTGYLSEADRPAAVRLRTAAQAGVIVLVIVSILQLVLFQEGFYDALWGSFFLTLREGLGTL